MTLGRLQKVELRDKALIPTFSQRDEGAGAQDFTPWLAREWQPELEGQFVALPACL